LMLYELLTGIHPFQGPDEHSTIFNFCTKEVVAPSQLAPHVPQAVDDVVMRALARDRNQRFQTGTEMARALTDALYTIVPNYRNYHFADFVKWALEGQGPVPRQSAWVGTGAVPAQHTGPGITPPGTSVPGVPNPATQYPHAQPSVSNPALQGQQSLGGQSLPGHSMPGTHTPDPQLRTHQATRGTHVVSTRPRSHKVLFVVIGVLGLLVIGAAIAVGVMLAGGDDDKKKLSSDESAGSETSDEGAEGGEEGVAESG